MRSFHQWWKMITLWFLLDIVATEYLELIQLDMKTAFLHNDLEKEIYMEQPKGFVEPSQEHLVCRLRKSLYGLKQAPRQWSYKKFDDFVQSVGLSKRDEDHYIFSKKAQDGSPIFLILYVDDMLRSVRHVGELADLVWQLQLKFGMKISRLWKQWQLLLSQIDYIRLIPEHFNMKSPKFASTPLPISLRLSQRDCPKSGPEGKVMNSLPFSCHFSRSVQITLRHCMHRQSAS